MNEVYVYSGTFSPPTFGHLSVVTQSARMFSELIIICSENPSKKNNWFSPEELKQLWQTYQLPKNVRVMTLPEFRERKIKTSKIVLVRGIRGDEDFSSEQQVIALNYKQFGVNKYFYIVSSKKYKNISSSKVRRDIENLNFRSLGRSVSPLIISALLEKFLQSRNIFMVVGRTGSGKSTFMKMMGELDASNYLIYTDNFNKQLRPMLADKFGEENLIKLNLERNPKLKKALVAPWFKLLAQSLKDTPKGGNIFIEIAYGLKADKRMFRFVGGKIIYFGCEDETKNIQRTNGRGTPELIEFIKTIPNKEETRMIAKKYRLAISYINTDCSLEEMAKKAKKLNELTLKKQNNVYDF